MPSRCSTEESDVGRCGEIATSLHDLGLKRAGTRSRSDGGRKTRPKVNAHVWPLMVWCARGARRELRSRTCSTTMRWKTSGRRRRRAAMAEWWRDAYRVRCDRSRSRHVAVGAGRLNATAVTDACPSLSTVSMYSLGWPEIRGTTNRGQLWVTGGLGPSATPGPAVLDGLVSQPLPLKWIWRMTGSGPFRIVAIAPSGMRVNPVWGPDRHGGSNWAHPADPNYWRTFVHA